MQDVALFFQHAAKCCDWCYIVSLLCIETMYAHETIFFIHLCNINSLLCKQLRHVPQLSRIVVVSSLAVKDLWKLKFSYFRVVSLFMLKLFLLCKLYVVIFDAT